VRTEQFDRLVQPGEIIFTFVGLHLDPGELGEPDDVEMGISHQLGIRFPSIAWPVFRVVVSSDKHANILLYLAQAETSSVFDAPVFIFPELGITDKSEVVNPRQKD
jgi:hypothetical protein